MSRNRTGSPLSREEAAHQLESITRLGNASAVFADAVIRAQSELRGTLSTECQRLNNVGTQRTVELSAQIEQGAMQMIRGLVECAKNWRKQHDELVENISTELSAQFSASGQRTRIPKSHRPGKSSAPSLGDETDVERVERVMGQALKEKDGELRHAALRALQEKAQLQEKLSLAQRDIRLAAEDEARRRSELQREMEHQSSRIAELEGRLTGASPAVLREPAGLPQLLPQQPELLPPPRLSPMQTKLRASLAEHRPESAEMAGDFGNLSSVLTSRSAPISTPPAHSAHTPGGTSVRFGGVTALDTESGQRTYADLIRSPNAETQGRAFHGVSEVDLSSPSLAVTSAPAVSVGPPAVSRAGPVHPQASGMPEEADPVGANGGSRNSHRYVTQPGPTRRGTDNAELGNYGPGWHAPATTTPAPAGRAKAGSAASAGHTSLPRPPPPPPAVLLSAEKADLIAQTAAHVAQNGESFVQVLLDQGPDFSFLRSSAPDRPDSLGHAYFQNCLRYELDKKDAASTGTGREHGSGATKLGGSLPAAATERSTLRADDTGEDTDEVLAGW